MAQFDLNNIAALITASTGYAVAPEDIQSIEINGNPIDIEGTRASHDDTPDAFNFADLFRAGPASFVEGEEGGRRFFDIETHPLRDYCEGDVALEKELRENLSFPDELAYPDGGDGDGAAFDNVLIEGDQVNIVEPTINIENLTINVG